jgi:hypothetical protein
VDRQLRKRARLAGEFDRQDQRLGLGYLREQAQHGESDRDRIGRDARPQTEGDSEGGKLGRRQALEPIEKRRAQLMEPREGQLHLGLHARRPDHSTPRGACEEVIQQGGLADPGFASDDDRAARSGSGIREEAIELFALGAPAPETWFGLGDRPHECSHRPIAVDL